MGGVRRLVWTAAAGVPTTAIAYAFYYRPDPSSSELKAAQWRISRWFKSNVCLSDHADTPDPIFMQVARFMTISSVTTLSKAVLFGANDMKIKDDERYKHLIRCIKYRPEGKPLLTVGNHNSTLDDPALFGAFAPWSVDLTPRQMRWTICSQEICFMNAFTSAFFGSGKVLPIERGGGIDQVQLLKFARRMAAGTWCHIFPEGRTVQLGHMGGRMGKNEAEIGTLKWGVGKLIAHAPVRPEIVPIYHTGMQNVVPEHPVTRDVLSPKPGTGHEITFRVGHPIVVDDLIEQYEKANGPLWKYTPSVAKDPPRFSWRSSSKELALYAAITRRVQTALEALEAEARAELGPNFPERPKIVISGEWKKLAGEE